MKCKIDDCTNDAWSRGWCRKHYARWHKHGDPHIQLRRFIPAGAPNSFLMSAAYPDTTECIVWPFTRNNQGYALINRDDKNMLATRIVCKIVNGPPPTQRHQAGHSCGNGHLGCISGKHLRWVTPKENSEEMVYHGNSTRGVKSSSAKLCEEQVLEIFSRAHTGEPQSKIANCYGITKGAVSRIKCGSTWNWLTSRKTEQTNALTDRDSTRCGSGHER